jgi:hypothetical protein
MTRPRYETASDLARELTVAEGLSQAWDADLCKVPTSYGLDYIVFGAGKFIGWVEVKTRPTMVWGDYPDVMVSLSKIRSAFVWSLMFGKPVYFCVRDANGELRAASISTVDPEWVKYGGRTRNTRDPADIEPVAHIPLDQFKPIEELFS